MKKPNDLLILFLFLVFVIRLNAQDSNSLRIDGKPELLFGELVDKSIRDVNGDVCAAIKIISSLTGLTFDSNNRIVKTTKKTGEDILYLQPSEQAITVYKTGYKPFKILLNDMGIRLNSGEVWKIEISGESKTIAINILVDKPDVEIKIDGVIQEKGSNTYNVIPGKRKLEISKSGYKSIIEDIDVSPSNIFFRYNLEIEKLISINIKSIPNEAVIYIDGKEEKKTDTPIFKVKGKYKLRLVKFGYLDYETELDVSENGKKEFVYVLKKNSGNLLINVNPSDANIVIDGRAYSPNNNELQPGKHFIEVNRELYESKFDTVDIELGKIITKNYSLIKKTGTLSLSVNPTINVIKINQQSYNITKPIELLEGNYLLEIDKNDFEKYAEPVLIKRGETLTINIKLIPMMGSLKLSISPLDANIRIYKNDKMIISDRGSRFMDSLFTGEYKIEVDNPNYISQTKSFKIEKDKITDTEIILMPKGVTDLNISKIISDESSVKNLSINKDGNSLIINYFIDADLNDEFDVSLFLMDGSNRNFEKQLQRLVGDYGKGKFSGDMKTIYWNWKEEFNGGIDNQNLFMLLRAEKVGKGIPWYVWAGGAIVGGVTAILLKGKSSSEGGTNTVNIPTPPPRPGN
jgi:hypothetical protein